MHVFTAHVLIPSHNSALQLWLRDEVFGLHPLDTTALERAIGAFERQLDIEAGAQQTDDSQAGKLALARSLGGSDETSMPRLTRSALEEKLRHRYSPVHVQARLAQIDTVLARLDADATPWRADGEALLTALEGNLWVPPEFSAERRAMRRDETMRVEALRARLLELRAGFAALPVDPQSTAREPAIVELD